MTTSAARDRACREISTGERSEVLAVLRRDPLACCPAEERLLGSAAADPGGSTFHTVGGPGRSVMVVSGTVQPLSGGGLELLGFARALGGTEGGGPSLHDQVAPGPMSVHGRRELALGLWEHLDPMWGVPSQVRLQRLLAARAPVTTDSRRVDPDEVRVATVEDMDRYLPAAAAMYREELGSDPLAPGTRAYFRRRVWRLLAHGRARTVVRDGRVVFKADIAALSTTVAQVQGVWVAPDLRGRGVGSACTAAVCAELQARGLVPSLVVNEANLAALAAYARVGLEPAVDYATVLVH